MAQPPIGFLGHIRSLVRSGAGGGTVFFVRGVPAAVEFVLDLGEEFPGDVLSCEFLNLAKRFTQLQEVFSGDQRPLSEPVENAVRMTGFVVPAHAATLAAGPVHCRPCATLEWRVSAAASERT